MTYEIIMRYKNQGEHIARRSSEISCYEDALEWLDYEGDMALRSLKEEGGGKAVVSIVKNGHLEIAKKEIEYARGELSISFIQYFVEAV